MIEGPMPIDDDRFWMNVWIGVVAALFGGVATLLAAVINAGTQLISPRLPLTLQLRAAGMPRGARGPRPRRNLRYFGKRLQGSALKPLNWKSEPTAIG